LNEYILDLGNFVEKIDSLFSTEVFESTDKSDFPNKIASIKDDCDVDFILDDTKSLIKECVFGMDKVKKIVQGLKNFSHTGEEAKEKTDINLCIEDTIRIVWNELKYHCEINKNFEECPETYCYPSQLNQVFMNLLINAGHAIKENGVITISTKYADETIFIEFQDNGSGIDEEHLTQLFNPFFTTKPVGQGTGLGLSISYGIIENHGGTINIKSKVGEGTCFYISLPVIDELETIDIDEFESEQSGDSL
jgi:signal transduction histidine kinase